jgi:hypothetical protein
MMYKPIEANINEHSVPQKLMGAVYGAELNKDKAPLTAILFEQGDRESFPTFRDELKFVLGRENGRCAADTHLYFGENSSKTLLLLACGRDHAEKIFEQYFSKLGGNGFTLGMFMHQYEPSPLTPEEVAHSRSFVRERTEQFYAELRQGLEDTKRSCMPMARYNLEMLAAGSVRKQKDSSQPVQLPEPSPVL